MTNYILPVKGYENPELLERMVGMRLVHIYGLPSVDTKEYGRKHFSYGEWYILMEDGSDYHVFAFTTQRGRCEDGFPQHDDTPDALYFKGENPFGKVLEGITYHESPRWTRCGYWETSTHLEMRFSDGEISLWRSDCDYDAQGEDDDFFFRFQVRMLPESEWSQCLPDWKLTALNGNVSA